MTADLIPAFPIRAGVGNNGLSTSPFTLLLNIAISGDWGGQKGIDNTIFPQRMEIDYVQVYGLLKK